MGCFMFFMDFIQVQFQLIDDLKCAVTDNLQGGFQFRKFLIGRPGTKIAQGIVCRVETEMFTYNKGDTFCFYFTGSLILMEILLVSLCYTVVPGMCQFMDCSFDSIFVDRINGY